MGRRRKERNEVGNGFFLFKKKKEKISRKEKERQRKHNEQAAKCQRDDVFNPGQAKWEWRAID